jgi:hypothetical protein
MAIYAIIVTIVLVYFGSMTYYLIKTGKEKDRLANAMDSLEAVREKNEVAASVDKLSSDAVSAKLRRRWERNT